MKKLSSLVIVVMVSFMFNGCEDVEETTNKKDIVKAVKILDLSNNSNFSNSAEYPAQIHPFKNSELAFELSGKIVKFNFKVGDSLKKGDVVAQLDDTIYKSNLNASKANYEKALSDYKRYQKLYKSKTISIDKLEQVKQNLDVTKSNYEVAKKNFENTKLVAEFDGVLAQKYIEDFARITAKQKIASLQDNTKFKVKFYVPESDIVREKKKISFEEVNDIFDTCVCFGEENGLKYKAKLIDISREAEKVTRTYEATALFDNPGDVNIFAGMTAKIRMIEKNNVDSTIFIPLKAVFSDSSKNSFVWAINKDFKVYKKQIKTGRLEKDSIEVIGGLTNSDKIAISGVNLLKENQQVKSYKKIGQ